MAGSKPGGTRRRQRSAEDQFQWGRRRSDLMIEMAPGEAGTDMDRQEGGRIGLGRRGAGTGRSASGSSDEEGVRDGADRANRGRNGWRCGGVGRTRRGSVPSGGNRRGSPTNRSRGTTEPWRGLRGQHRPHHDEPPPRFEDAVHRTLTRHEQIIRRPVVLDRPMDCSPEALPLRPEPSRPTNLLPNPLISCRNAFQYHSKAKAVASNSWHHHSHSSSFVVSRTSGSASAPFVNLI